MNAKIYIRTRYFTSKIESKLFGLLEGFLMLPILVLFVFVLIFFDIKSPIAILISAVVFFAIIGLWLRIRILFNAKILIEDDGILIEKYSKVKVIKFTNVKNFRFSGYKKEGFIIIYLDITELDGNHTNLEFNRTLVESPVKKYELIKKIIEEKNIFKSYNLDLNLEFAKN